MKNKLRRWWRIVKWSLNSLWYHVLFPVGIEEDSVYGDKILRYG